MHKVYKPGEYPKEHNYEEICPYCDEPIAVVVEDYCYDYDATCPVCGKPLMLCTLCRWDYVDGCPLTGYKKCGQNCYEDLARPEEAEE